MSMSKPMKPIFIIARWKEWFTCSQSNKVVTNPTWTPIPVMKDIRARRRLFMIDGGVEAYGVLMAIVGLAAQMPVRGVLIDDTGAVLDALDIASLTGLDASLVERALAILMKPDIGYVDRCGRDAAGKLIPFDPTATGLFASAHTASAPGPDPATSTLPARSQPSPSTVDDAGSQTNEDESEDERRVDETRPPAGEPSLRLVSVENPTPAPIPSLEKAREPSSLSSSPPEPRQERPKAPEKTAYGIKASEPEGTLASSPPAGDLRGYETRSPAQQDLAYDVCRMKFDGLVKKLRAPTGSQQGRSDITDTANLFEDFIWQEGWHPPPDVQDRMRIAGSLAEAAMRNGKNKMAWFKNEMLYRLGKVGERPPPREKRGVG